jgi:hypothetical protein
MGVPKKRAVKNKVGYWKEIERVSDAESSVCVRYAKQTAYFKEGRHQSGAARAYSSH